MLLGTNAELERKLDDMMHNLSFASPAFSNLTQTVRAFGAFRRAIGPDAACQIKITAPKEADNLGLTFGQLAVIGSNCNTFGTLPSDADPEIEKEATTGMIADTLIVHMAKNSKGSVQLCSDLQNLIKVKRSSEVPPESPPHYVWLQFGNASRWNSPLQFRGQ